LSTTNSYIDKAFERMNSIEELFTSNSKKSKYDELIERFTYTESVVELRHNEMDKIINEMQAKFELYESRLNGMDIATKNTEKIIVNIEDKLIQSNVHVTRMYEEFEARINDMYSQFRQDILNGDVKIQEIQDICNQCNTLSSENNSLIEVVKDMMQKVQESCDQNVYQINKLKDNKISVEMYEINNMEIGNRFRILDFQTRTLNNLITVNDE